MARPAYELCPRNHPYDRTVKRSNGTVTRVCGTCANEANRRYRMRKRIEQLQRELEEENGR